MERPTRPNYSSPARVFAWVSGVAGVLAGLFLLGFFALDSHGVRLAGLSLGYVNDILGAIQFAAFTPVAWALGRQLPATRTVRAFTAAAVAAAVAFVVLSVLLVTGVLTFDQQIGFVIIAIIAINCWLLVVNLVAHRDRALPRAVSRTGVLVGAAMLTAQVLVAAGYALSGAVSQAVTWLGYGLGLASWLALPAYVLVLALRVFSPFPSTARSAAATPIQKVRS